MMLKVRQGVIEGVWMLVLGAREQEQGGRERRSNKSQMSRPIPPTAIRPEPIGCWEVFFSFFLFRRSGAGPRWGTSFRPAHTDPAVPGLGLPEHWHAGTLAPGDAGTGCGPPAPWV